MILNFVIRPGKSEKFVNSEKWSSRFCIIHHPPGGARPGVGAKDATRWRDRKERDGAARLGQDNGARRCRGGVRDREALTRWRRLKIEFCRESAWRLIERRGGRGDLLQSRKGRGH